MFEDLGTKKGTWIRPLRCRPDGWHQIKRWHTQMSASLYIQLYLINWTYNVAGDISAIFIQRNSDTNFVRMTNSREAWPWVEHGVGRHHIKSLTLTLVDGDRKGERKGAIFWILLICYYWYGGEEKPTTSHLPLTADQFTCSDEILNPWIALPQKTLKFL